MTDWQNTPPPGGPPGAPDPPGVTTAASTTGPPDGAGVEYHLVRGALWGFLLGLGLGIYALIFRVIELDQVLFWLLVLLGVVLGLLWARFAPPRH